MDTKDDPNIQFDEDGVCTYCEMYAQTRERFVFDGPKNEYRLASILSKIKSKGHSNEYDCVIGISGGVDSTYLAYKAKKLGLRPLAVHLDNGWNSELASKNIRNIISKLGLDLETLVVDWNEFKDIQISFLKASVVDIEMVTDHAINAALFKIAAKNHIKYILTGVNYATEGYLPLHWRHMKNDLINLTAIHNEFGLIKLNTYPTMGIVKQLVYEHIYGIKRIPLLNYIEYDKRKAESEISTELDWQNYEQKHYESIFTRFYQAYILPIKFDIDKRKSHLSTLVCAGQITREEAVATMKVKPYDTDQIRIDKEYAIKKLGLTELEFEKIMNLPIKRHDFYPSFTNYYRYYTKLRAIARVIIKGK